MLTTTLISLNALRAGDTGAWRALFETYAEPLYLYAYHRCGRDPAGAEDIRQETFLIAIEKIDTFREDAPFFGWLCGIARHKAADWVRKQRREYAPQLLGEDEDEEAAAVLWDLEQPLPEEWVVRGDTRAAVVEALWSLPVDYRKALIWRYERGESVDQLAARLCKTYKAVESLLSRARLALRNAMLTREF